jgi:WD40 repeat protein
MVVTASADKTVMVHPLTIQRAVAVAKTPVRAIALNAAGTHVLTGDDSNQFKGWNTANGVADKSFDGAAGPVYAVAASKSGLLVASGGAEKIVRIYNFADAKLVGSITAPAIIRGLAFHPTLPIVGAVCEDKSIHAWNINFVAAQPLPPEFGKLIQSFTQAEAISGIAFSGTGPLFSSGLDKTVKQWKLAADTPAHNFQHPNLVDAVAFDPAGKMLATGCHDGNLRTFDLEKNAVAKTIVAHVQTQPANQQNPIYAVAWTPDGKQVISASYDKTLKLWDATAGTLVREFKGYDEKAFPKGHRDQVFTVVFTKDGKTIATGSSDRSIKLWNVADGTVLREFVNPNIKQADPKVDNPTAHPGWVYSVKFTADEKYLVSVGSAPKNQGYLAVWNVADGKMLYGAELPYGPIYSVAISKDGTQLLLGCGPKDRMNPVSEAVTIKMPVK